MTTKTKTKMPTPTLTPKAPTPAAITKATRAQLEAIAQPDVRTQQRAYFKNAVDFIGVKMPKVREVAAAMMPSLKDADVDDVVAVAFAFLRSPLMEMKSVGAAVLERRKKELDDAFLDELAPLFDEGHVADWATCDDLAGHVLRELVARSAATRKRVIAWSRAKNEWQQRASAVAFANECRKLCHGDDILDVCSHIVRSQGRFVQLGCGWALREMSVHEMERVIAFIDDNAKHLSREGLSYAVEKMPLVVRVDVKARHAAQSGRGKRAV